MVVVAAVVVVVVALVVVVTVMMQLMFQPFSFHERMEDVPSMFYIMTMFFIPLTCIK